MQITFRSSEDLVMFAAEAENPAAGVVLRRSAENEFSIVTQTGLVSAPLEVKSDPESSNFVLRAIAGAASLTGYEFPNTVYPELLLSCTDFRMPLPQVAKPDALAIAQMIWNKVKQKVPQAETADHTEKDSMGTTNLGSMFKVCSLLLAQGALCKYRLNVIP